MSKSLKNVVNPDDVVRDYGADSLRLYEMFMGPLDAVKPWQTKGIEGMNRFLGRAWRSVVGDSDEAPVFVDETAPEAIEKVMHQTVIKVTSDIENMSFNTAISQLMIFNNEMMKMDKRYREPCETFVKLLHPFAPHIAEEMWSILGVFCTKAVENAVEVVFQVNGKTVVKSIVVPGKLVNIVVK